MIGDTLEAYCKSDVLKTKGRREEIEEAVPGRVLQSGPKWIIVQSSVSVTNM